jgi:hypothetical protein
MSLVKLWSNQGADECNVANRSCRVGNDGSVWVPEEGIGPLLAVGGFSLADPPARQPVVGNARMVHPDKAVHGRTLKFDRPADLVLTPRSVVSLQGCGPFDGPYWPRSIERRLSFEAGFVMSTTAKSIPSWLQT